MPRPVGAGAAYRPGVRPPPVAPACRPSAGRRRGLHLELFAHRHVVVVAAGIGVLGPRREGAYVRAGRCFHPLITLEPTGVIELAAGTRGLRLGDLFALWGQPLGPRRMAGFGRAPVRAYVDGRAVGGDPAAIRLAPHQEIVLETGGYVAPHRSYRFAPGL